MITVLLLTVSGDFCSWKCCLYFLSSFLDMVCPLFQGHIFLFDLLKSHCILISSKVIWRNDCRVFWKTLMFWFTVSVWQNYARVTHPPKSQWLSRRNMYSKLTSNVTCITGNFLYYLLNKIIFILWWFMLSQIMCSHAFEEH